MIAIEERPLSFPDRMDLLNGSPASLTSIDRDDSSSCMDSWSESSCLSSSSLSSSDSIETDDQPFEAASTTKAPAARVSSGKVSFCETVTYRIVSYDEESDKDSHVDSVIRLKKGDYSKPLPPSVKRARHDFAKIYGCGKTIRTFDDVDLDSGDDEAFLNSEPAKVIEAHAPSAFWFSAF